MAFTAISALLITLILVISYYCYRRCFYAPPRRHNNPYEPLKGDQYTAVGETIFKVTSIMERYAYEDVAITAHDSTPLRGRYYHFADGVPLMILCHGYRSSLLRDCCGGHALSRKLGFNVLAIHQRCHGESGGRTITFGIRERHDLLAWIRWANDRFGTEHPIVLSGLSMGAATVLMGIGLGYPDNVVCVMADSPYSAPADIILKVCKDIHYPPRLCYPFIYLGALLYGHFRLDACTALESVRHAKVPVLLIHGEDDRLVPVEMSRDIQSSCAAPCDLHTFPGAGHGLCYMVDPQHYERAVFDFLNKIPKIRNSINEEFKNSLK